MKDNKETQTPDQTYYGEMAAALEGHCDKPIDELPEDVRRRYQLDLSMLGWDGKGRDENGFDRERAAKERMQLLQGLKASANDSEAKRVFAAAFHGFDELARSAGISADEAAAALLTSPKLLCTPTELEELGVGRTVQHPLSEWLRRAQVQDIRCPELLAWAAQKYSPLSEKEPRSNPVSAAPQSAQVAQSANESAAAEAAQYAEPMAMEMPPWVPTSGIKTAFRDCWPGNIDAAFKRANPWLAKHRKMPGRAGKGGDAGWDPVGIAADLLRGDPANQRRRVPKTRLSAAFIDPALKAWQGCWTEHLEAEAWF